MKLELGKTTNITLKPAVAAQTIAVQAVDVITINDDCENKVVALVDIGGTQRALTLWEEEEYKKIGNWTQEQAEERIKELLLTL